MSTTIRVSVETHDTIDRMMAQDEYDSADQFINEVIDDSAILGELLRKLPVLVEKVQEIRDEWRLQEIDEEREQILARSKKHNPTGKVTIPIKARIVKESK